MALQRLDKLTVGAVPEKLKDLCKDSLTLVTVSRSECFGDLVDEPLEDLLRLIVYRAITGRDL